MKSKLFVLFFFVCLSTQLNLIRDTNTPLFIESPFKTSNSQFNLRFSFPAGSSDDIGINSIASPGLNYKQFFGVKFPSNTGGDLQLNKWEDPKFECSLTDGTNSYQVTAVTAAQSKVDNFQVIEPSTAYCRLDEPAANLPLKVGQSIVYTLQIKLLVQVSTNFINNISLFTATSNDVDKIIIDYLPVIGNAVLYNSWTDWTSTKPIDIVSANFEVANGVPSASTGYKLFPYVNFNLKVQLIVNDFISMADYMIVFKYPAYTVSPSNVITSLAADATHLALNGNLVLRSIGTNSLFLDGIQENFSPGRQFTLDFTGWTALDTDVGTARPFELVLYYKNTYSICSYTSVNIFNVESTPLAVTANHQEFWDIFRNAAWPMSFTFTNKNKLAGSQYFVVIQHNNALLSSTNDGNIVTFVASTCDFSANTNFNSSIGVRQSCYPLRLDQHYPGENTLNQFSGSGIFFSLPGPININQIFNVNVWIYADNCGGYNLNNFSGTAFSIPEFTISIYGNINPNEINENRFDPNNQNMQLIAQGIQSFDGKCWNNKIADFNPTNMAQVKNDNYFQTDYVNDDALTGTNNKKFTIKFREIFSWKTTSRFHSACTNCFDNNISTGTFSENFIYSSTNNLNNGSYFLAYTGFNSVGNNLWTVMPSGIMITNPSANTNPENISGRLKVLFSKAWFTGSNNYAFNSSAPCYLSWACSSGNSDLQKLSKDITAPSSGKNYIAAKRGLSASSSEFDEVNSNLIPNSVVNSRSNIMQLVSQFYTNGGSNNWAYVEDVSTSGSFGFAWFTNCITWNLNANNSVKSLFTYIDIQYQWSYAETSTNTPSNIRIFSNVRLIKLFPEGGVFQDFNKFPNNANSVNPYINHFVMAQNANYSPVCLIEINGAAIQNVSTPNSNSFILWLGLSSILETDYVNTAATYPVAPLVSTAKVYGLQSQNPFHDQNLYVSDDYISNGYPNFLLPPLFRALWSIQNDKSITGTYGQVVRGSNQSIYHFLLGSVLVFTGLNNGTLQGTTSPLFIPYYCNYAKENSNYDNRVVLNLPPTLFGAWTTINSYDSVSKFDSFLTYTIDSNNSFSVLTSAMNFSTQNNILYGAYKGYKGGNLSATSIYTSQYTATLTWNAYTDSDSGLNVYNANRKNTQNLAMTCTGYSIFLSSIISIKNPLTINANGQIFHATFQSSNFYVMGKKFSNAIFVGGLTLGDGALNNINNPNLLTGNPPFSIVGVQRPTVDSFIQNGELVVSDKIGFSCISADTNQYNALTNYFYSDISQTNFVLDWTSSNSNWSGSIGFDKNDISKQDYAGNVLISVTTPATLPFNSTINIGSTSSFNSNTICGIIIDTNHHVKECINTSGIFSCQVPVTGTNFNICCYNIYVGNSIVLSELSADFNTEPNNYDLSGYLLNNLYSADSQLPLLTSPFQFNTHNSASPDIIGTQYATITNVIYSHVLSEGGIGKISITIQLPREPTRDMKLSIIGDFTSLLIPGTGNNPRCVATFGQNSVYGSTWDNGDILIDSCSTNNISNGNPVIITTRKMIYKCGISFSKILQVSLWPVSIVNWNTSAKNKFIVSMQLNSLDAVALNSKNVSIPPVTVSQKANFIGQWDTLCPVVSVSPNIPSEIAEYTFEFDLDTNKGVLSGSILNEISIFWPYQFYGSSINNPVCYYISVLNCYFSDEGILIIQFPQSLPIGSGNKIPIIISGIPNPEINYDYSFPCTINSIDSSSHTRSNIITGSGKMLGGITTGNIVLQGGLRFLNVAQPTSNSNPRNTSTHTFRITLDEAYGLSSLPISINNPIIVIYFPDEYQLSFYINTPSATINEYTVNPQSVISQTSTYLPYNLEQSANKIIITFGVNVTLSSNWKYWEIILTNIVDPINSTISPGLPVTQSTAPFRITLTNSEETIYYTTFSNSNSYTNSLIPNSVMSNIMWSRGNIFQFDGSQYVVDLYSNSAHPNRITVRAGRYSPAFMNIEAASNLANLPLAATTISLTDPIFATSESSYELPVAYYTPFMFLIGCPCNTAEGHYLVIFNSSETSIFAPLSPIIVTVQTSISWITFQAPTSSIPNAGSQWINYYISEPNFDLINITWKKLDTLQNDETAMLSNAVILNTLNFDPNTGTTTPVARSVFSIETLNSIPYSQGFYTKDPNKCFSFGAVNTIAFTTQGPTATLSSQTNLNTHIKYANSNLDNTLSKNSVEFTFTPFAYPVYLYCALVCYDNDYPVDSDIINPVENNSIFLQFYSTQINSSNVIKIVFSNLIRNQRYKLRCIVQSTEADVDQRTSISESLENPFINSVNPSAQSQIIPTAPFATQCLQWNFVTDPGNAARLALITYCQKTFSYNGGWFNNSCVICTDAELALESPGLYINKNRTCSADAPTITYAQSIQNNNTVSNYTSFTLCPVPHPVCTSDGGFTNSFNQLASNLQSNTQLSVATSLNLQLSPRNSFLIINDNSKPDINSLNVKLLNYTNMGNFTLSANYPTPVLCYWKIDALTGNLTLPFFHEIQSCIDISWCGNTVINPIGIQIQNDPVNIRRFANGVTYNVYFACNNYIPFPVYKSDVKIVLSFTMNPSRFISSIEPPANRFTFTLDSDYSRFSSLRFLLMIILLLM